MKTIAMIGTGYVGLVSGTCLAHLGHNVTCIDIDASKIARLQQGQSPIYEPGLQQLLDTNIAAGRLRFTTSYAEGLDGADFVFIAVNTPTGPDNATDMRYVRSAAESIARTIDHDIIIVNKSTMPVGSGDLVAQIVAANIVHPVSYAIVSNPEFLAQGSAVHDFMHPDRVVLGSTDAQAASQVATLYLPLRAPIMLTDLYTAEMIKYASNAFLAAKVSFINEIARICEELGADVREVATGMGYDKRIGQRFLEAGVGFGGSCFGKDVTSLAHMAQEAGLHPQMLNSVLEINHDQRLLAVQKVADVLGDLHGTTIGVLGLAFKPNTDDMRDAPAIDIIRELIRRGARVQVYDPVAMPIAMTILGSDDIMYCPDAYETASGANALILVTQWDEFRTLDLEAMRTRMRQPVLIDGRNLFSQRDMVQRGFIYRGIGVAPQPTPVPLTK